MTGLEKDISYYRQLLLRYNNNDRHLKEIRGIRKRIVHIIDEVFKGDEKDEWLKKIVQIEVDTVQPITDYDDEYQLMKEYYHAYKKTGNPDDGIECYRLKDHIYSNLIKKYDPDIDLTTFAKYNMILLIDIDYPKLMIQKIIKDLDIMKTDIISDLKAGKGFEESFDNALEKTETKKIISIEDWKNSNKKSSL